MLRFNSGYSRSSLMLELQIVENGQEKIKIDLLQRLVRRPIENPHSIRYTMIKDNVPTNVYVDMWGDENIIYSKLATSFGTIEISLDFVLGRIAFVDFDSAKETEQRLNKQLQCLSDRDNILVKTDNELFNVSSLFDVMLITSNDNFSTEVKTAGGVAKMYLEIIDRNTFIRNHWAYYSINNIKVEQLEETLYFWDIRGLSNITVEQGQDGNEQY